MTIYECFELAKQVYVQLVAEEFMSYDFRSGYSEKNCENLEDTAYFALEAALQFRNAKLKWEKHHQKQQS